MYNTVGETAGVTQDVGSDPTVGDPDRDLYHCCTLCGTELGEEIWGEGVLKGEEHGQNKKGVNVTAFDLSEMSRLEDEDEEMDGEPDTTGDDQEMTGHYGGAERDGRERCGQRILHPTNPERKSS